MYICKASTTVHANTVSAQIYFCHSWLDCHCDQTNRKHLPNLMPSTNYYKKWWQRSLVGRSELYSSWELHRVSNVRKEFVFAWLRFPVIVRRSIWTSVVKWELVLFQGSLVAFLTLNVKVRTSVSTKCLKLGQVIPKEWANLVTLVELCVDRGSLVTFNRKTFSEIE